MMRQQFLDVEGRLSDGEVLAVAEKLAQEDENVALLLRLYREERKIKTPKGEVIELPRGNPNILRTLRKYLHKKHGVRGVWN
jgi:hypothetical protein